MLDGVGGGINIAILQRGDHILHGVMLSKL